MRKSWKERNKYMRKNERNANDNIRRIITPSILGIMICMVCLAGTTWAWFTAQSGINDDLSVKAAEVKVEVIVDGESKGFANGKEPCTVNIKANKAYSVILNATSVTATNGYCSVEVEGKTYVADIKEKQEIRFAVNSTDDKMTVTTSWKAIHGEALIGTIGTGGASTQENENNGDRNDKNDVITNKDDTDDGNTEKDNVSDKSGGDTPEPGDTSEQNSDSGTQDVETHAAE